MGQNFLAYIQFLEIITFFTGYPIIFALIVSFDTNSSRFKWLKSAGSFLPFSYAFIGTLYIGLQLKNFYPDYSLARVQQAIAHPWVLAWALLSLCFYIPALARRKQLSLLHSLVFFFLFARYFYYQYTSPDQDILVIRNYMRLYTVSMVLHLVSLLLLVFLSRITQRNH